MLSSNNSAALDGEITSSDSARKHKTLESGRLFWRHGLRFLFAPSGPAELDKQRLLETLANDSEIGRRQYTNALTLTPNTCLTQNSSRCQAARRAATGRRKSFWICTLVCSSGADPIHPK